MTDVTTDKIYTVKEVADIFSISSETVRDWINTGKIKAFKLGKQWRVHHRDVLALAEAKYV